MKRFLFVVLIGSLTWARVVREIPVRRISDIKCEEYAQHSTFVPNKYQSYNCSLRLHESARYDDIEPSAAEFRHLAKIYTEDNLKTELICNGALISDQYVLTSAQCVSDPHKIPKWVRLGDNDQKTIQDFNITTITKHPYYKLSEINHNLALLKLDRIVTFSPQYVLPACLHTVPDAEEHKSLFIAGWGIRDIDLQNDFDADVEASPQKCGNDLDLLKNADASKVICTQSQLCEWIQIYPGAPVQIERKDIWCIHDVIGVTVLAKGFTCEDKSDVNINIKIFDYVDWIESIVWPETK